MLLDVVADLEQVVVSQLPEDEREQIRFAVLLDLLTDSPLDRSSVKALDESSLAGQSLQAAFKLMEELERSVDVSAKVLLLK